MVRVNQSVTRLVVSLRPGRLLLEKLGLVLAVRPVEGSVCIAILSRAGGVCRLDRSLWLAVEGACLVVVGLKRR